MQCHSLLSLAMPYMERRLRLLLRLNTAVTREAMDKVFQWEIKQLRCSLPNP
jgi:hypothetical protein